MANESFNYERCIEIMDSVVSPQKTELPDIQGKNSSIYEISQYMMKSTLPVLYRYMPLNLNALSSIINGDVYMVTASKMNDIFEGAAFGTNSSPEMNQHEIQRIQNEIYLKSFSYAKDNNLMWSHYGDAHKGICIGYDFSKVSEEVRQHLYPVQYSDTRFSFIDAERIAAHPFLCLRKSSEWKYEKEFRMIYKKDELTNGNNIIKLDCISEIIFGLRTDSQKIEIVKRLLCSNNKVKLYQTKQEDNSFKLKRIELDKPCGMTFKELMEGLESLD